MTKFRQPTVEEAAQSILRSLTKEFRKASLLFFKAEYGEEFANQVKLYVEKHWRKK